MRALGAGAGPSLLAAPMIVEPHPGWDGLGTEAGLCRTCRHARLLASNRSTFLRCGRSDTDPRFLRYPALPVWGCVGWETLERPTSEPSRGPGTD